jgi:hypothetical protein
MAGAPPFSPCVVDCVSPDDKAYKGSGRSGPACMGVSTIVLQGQYRSVDVRETFKRAFWRRARALERASRTVYLRGQTCQLSGKKARGSELRRKVSGDIACDLVTPKFTGHSDTYMRLLRLEALG